VKSDYSTSSRLQRFLAILAAGVVTGTLFAAVALGLAGDDGSSLFAHSDDGAAQTVVEAG
jgi:hypothetical protein